MVTIKLSKEKKLVLPESLGRSLGLREGDRVKVRRQDNVLWLQRKESLGALGPLTDLSRIVSSSRPVGSVDVEKVLYRIDRASGAATEVGPHGFFLPHGGDIPMIPHDTRCR